MSTKKNVFVFALMTACLAFTTVQAKVNIQPLSKPITIVEQGSFAAGGTVLKNKGKFDPYKMGPEGQTLHGDHAYVFYQVPQNASGLPLVFLCTVPDSPEKLGKQHRMDAKVSKRSS